MSGSGLAAGAVGTLSVSGGQLILTVVVAPTITTTVAPNTITHNSASSGGQTLSGTNITAKGVVWNTSTAPTVALTTKTDDGTGTDNFTSSITSLSAQTQYFVRAYVTNAAGTGYGDEKSFRTLSSPATAQASGFSATATSSSNIDLSWTGATFPGSGATASGYILLRAISPNTPSLGNSNGAAPTAGANTTIVSSSIANNATSFSNSGLASSTTYNYLLVPFTWDGTNATTYNYLTASAPTGNATTQAGATPPVLTTNAATSISASGATLNGEITSDGGGSVTARGFVYSSTDLTPTIGESGVTDQSAGTGTGSYNASVSLSENTTYYFQAYATNSSGTSYGGVLNFTTPKAEPTAQPTSLVFSSVTTSSFSTAFTAATGSPDGYIVIRSTSATLSANPADGTTYTAGNSLGGGTILSVGATVSGISSSSLSAGTTYYVFVFAYNNSGSIIDYLTTSPLSSSVVTVTSAPSAPSFGSVTTTGATVSWAAVTGAADYRLDVSTVSNFASFVSGYNDLTVSGTSQALTGLTPNTNYFARVRAVNASGTSASSSSGSAATLHNAPTVGSGSGATTSAITANWTAPTGGGAVTFTYTLELSTNAADFSSPVSTQVNIASGTLSFQFTLLTQGTVYYYRVRAVNATGASDWSAVSTGYSTLATTISLAALGTAVTENFNGMGTSGTATTPTGIRIGTDFTTGTSATTLTYGNTGTGVVTSSSSGGAINWADGVAGSATDRALGFLTTGSYTSPRSIICAFTNNTGSAITNLQLSWDYEKYRSGTRAIDWTFFHGSTSAAATAATAGDQSYAADANTSTVFSPSSDIAKSLTLTGLNIADGATYYLRWTYTGVGGSTNSQGLAIDDLSIKGCGTVSAPTAADQAFCSAVNPTIASLTATGSGIQWYAASSGGSALSTSAALTNNTIYYASQTVGGCESVTRTAVTVTINTNPSVPTGSATQTFCSSASPTVSSLTASGTSIQWYSASTGGTALSGSNALVNTTYHATQTVNGCESQTRLAVTAQVFDNGTWLGDVSGDWNTSGNWCGGVPTSSSNVVVVSGRPNSPVISSAASAASLTINSGASLSFSGTPTLTLSGNLTNNGTFTAGSSTVAFNAASTVSGTVAFNNVTLSASMNPGTASTINGLLLLNSSGSISTNSPSFGTSSTLEYGYGGGFGSRRNQALEWPSSNGPANLTVSNGSWIQLTGSRSLSGNVSISNGALQASGARTLTMNGTTQTITVSNSTGGAIFGTDNGFGNDLTLTIANGSTTTFTGNATTNGDDEKKFVAINVNTGGTLALSRGILCKYGSFTVNGTLQINSNGYVQSTAGVAPTYGASSTLVYNSGGTYGRGLEWSATSGAGYPNNVTLSNSTNLDVVNGDNSFKRAAGNLTVNTGSTFSVPNLTVGSSGLGVEFLGSITNDGTISLTGTTDERLKAVSLTNGSSNSTATVNLSSVVGGDLELTGNYTDNANFNANSRAVFFTGSGTQTIGGTASAPFNIDYIVLNKTSGIVQLSQDLLTGAPNGGNGITLNSASDIIDLNGRTLTLGTNNQTCAISGNGLFRGNSASGMIINGTGALGTLRFESGNRSLANLTINRTGTGSVTLGSDLSVGSTLTLTDGVLNVGSNNLSVGGSVARTSGTINAASGTVTFNGGSAQSVPTGLFTSGTLSNLTVPNNGGVSFSENLTVTGNLTVNGLFIPAADVVVGGAGTLTGTGTIRVTRATGTADLTNQYTLNRTLTNLTAEFAGTSAQGIAASTIGGLKINNSNGLSLGGDVTVTGGVDFTSGNLSIGANTLSIGGAVSRTSGNFVGGATSNLTLNGTAGSIFFQSGGSSNSLKALTLGTSGSATLGNDLNIVANDGSGNEGVVAVNSTTGGLNTGGFLTLKSAANGTARVAAGRTAGGYITGAVSVERFIPQNSTKSWRLLAANTSGQSINDAWQEGQAGVNLNNTPGFGTMITGQGVDDADAIAKGFDKKTPGYSVLRYNSSVGALWGILNTKTTLLDENSGYFLFIRGDRGNSGSFGAGAPNSSTTLRSKGSLFTGNQSPITIPSGQFALIGNPYPSRIDLREISIGSGIVNSVQVWDPTLAGSYGLGGYQTLVKSGNDFIVSTPGGGSYGSINSVQNFIESGSAFFVQSTSNSNNTVTIAESCKASGSRLVNRPSSPLSLNPSMISRLFAINSATNTELADGNRIDYDPSYSNSIDVFDVRKNNNFGDNLGLSSNNTDLVVERRAMPTENDTIFFSTSGLKRIGYRLDFMATDLGGTGLSAVLEDTYLNTATPVSLEGTTSYTFTVDANAGSSAARRFRIVFRPQAPLPVTLRSVRAWQQQSDIKVEWTVANQLNIQRYVVEKSVDGSSFSAVGNVTATGNNRAEITYNWLDAQPVQGANYYRIRSIGNDGAFSISSVVRVVIGKSAPAVSVWPNPVEGRQMNLNFVNMQAGAYQVRLLNTLGQITSVNKISHSGGSAVQIIALPSQLVAGIYNLEVISPDNSRQLQQVNLK